ncbi:MAG: hypothetical protein HKK67_08845 [Chlorobiaceae bacterium]|nr:hypothetical protein [Chlorobiaceae bacterium]
MPETINIETEIVVIEHNGEYRHQSCLLGKKTRDIKSRSHIYSWTATCSINNAKIITKGSSREDVIRDISRKIKARKEIHRAEIFYRRRKIIKSIEALHEELKACENLCKKIISG